MQRQESIERSVDSLRRIYSVVVAFAFASGTGCATTVMEIVVL